MKLRDALPEICFVTFIVIAGLYLGTAAYGDCREAGNTPFFCATAVFG